MSVVRVSGSHYECGLGLGRAAGEKVRRNLDYYLGWWERNLGLGKQQVYRWAEEVLGVSKEFDAGLVDELRGVADGAGIDLEAVAALNARYELAWASKEQLLPSCTSLALLPRRTARCVTILAQNWDYRVDVAPNCLLYVAEAEGEPSVYIHTEAGIIGHKGFNGAGLGVAVNALVSSGDHLGESVPFFLVCRKALASRGLDSALSTILEARRCFSYNMVLAAPGVAVDVEAYPGGASLLLPEEGVLVHTNHFLGETPHEDPFLHQHPNTVTRLVRAKELLGSRGLHSYRTVAQLLSDHQGLPTSICHHPEEAQPPDLRAATLSSTIMVLEEGTMYYTEGSPCSSDYRRFQLQSKPL